jgi:hypothetical protein
MNIWPAKITWLGIGAMASLLGAVVLAAFLIADFSGGDEELSGLSGRAGTSVISVKGGKAQGRLPSTRGNRSGKDGVGDGFAGSFGAGAAGGEAGFGGGAGGGAGDGDGGGGSRGDRLISDPTVAQYGDSLRRIEGLLSSRSR